MFAVFVGQASAQIGTTTLDVPGTAPWYDTGIDVFAGDELDITATGIVSYNLYAIGGPLGADANGGDSTGQNLFSLAVLPHTMIHSLIGKIGGTTDVGTGAPVPEGLPGDGVGFIGTSYSKPLSTSGRLFLGYNDEVPYFYYNGGSFHVIVTAVPEPSACTMVLMGIGAVLGSRLRRRSP